MGRGTGSAESNTHRVRQVHTSSLTFASSFPPAQPYFHLVSLLQPLLRVLICLLSHFLLPTGPFTKALHRASHLLLSHSQASISLCPIPALCPPTLRIRPSSRESRLLCSPGRPHLCWDGQIPAKSIGTSPHPAPTSHSAPGPPSSACVESGDPGS